MKNIKFSRLFAAVTFVAILALAGCKQPDEETPYAIEGTWITEWNEKYVISNSNYDNYYTNNNGTLVLYYKTNNVQIVEVDNNSGFVYGQFYDENYIGSGATVGQWYALYYSDLTDTNVKLYQAYKSNGRAACDTLDEAKSEFTLDNGYFDLSNPSVGTRQE